MSFNTRTMWRTIITSLYPDLLHRTYRVPPDHFNKVPYSRDTVHGTGRSVLVLPVTKPSQPSGGAAPAHTIPPASQPSGSATPVHTIPPTSQPSGSTTPVHTIPPASQPSGSATPVHTIPPTSQPSGSATPVHTIPPTSQPSGSATPVHTIPPASQPSGSATPVHTISPASQPSGSAALQNVPPASQQSNPPFQYSVWTQEPQPPAKPVRVQESDYRDDFAQRQTLANLQELGNAGQEPMFILSQLNFGDYLNEPSYAAAVKASQLPKLPRPSDLGTKYKAGDFDILLIHRRHGILVGELKSVGLNQPGVSRTPAPDNVVAEKVGKAVKQLDKSETVVKHLVSDIAPGLTVRKTLFLPYVSSTQLRRVLTADPKLEQEVCRCLGAGSTADAVQLCCCSDQLSDSATYRDVTPAVLSQLTTWWQHRMACFTDLGLTDDLYLDIVARFVGPATSVKVHCSVPPRVEVRTIGEAVAELGRKLAYLVLTRQQLDLMLRSPPLVFLVGPPGTGKTIMLILQGLKWARKGHDVHIVSKDPDSLAVSLMIQHQLQMTLSAHPTASPKAGTVRLHQYVLTDFDRAVSDLLSAVHDDTLCVLFDEANRPSTSNTITERLVSELTCQVPHLYLWMAGVGYTVIPPELQTEVLTTPLRCAPIVLGELGPEVDLWSHAVYGYSDSGLPAPGDGPSVLRLSHRGNAHTGHKPTDCEMCGKNVAAELRHLGVGTWGSHVSNNPSPLAFRDVFVLTDDMELQDDVRDNAGRVTSPASGFVRGLRDEQIPVCVLEYRVRVGDVAGWESRVPGGRAGWESRVEDVAVAKTDQVTVAFWESVHGLERRVVVCLNDKGEKGASVFTLYSVSRCTTQLIIVDI